MDTRSTTAKDMRGYAGASAGGPAARIIAACRGGRRRRAQAVRVVLALLLGAIAMLVGGGDGGGATAPAEAQNGGTTGHRDSMCYYTDASDTVQETPCPCTLKVVKSHEITDDNGDPVSNPVGFNDANAVSLDQAKLIIGENASTSRYRIRMQCDVGMLTDPNRFNHTGARKRFIRYQTGIIDQTRAVNVPRSTQPPMDTAPSSSFISDSRKYRGIVAVEQVGYANSLAAAEAFVFPDTPPINHGYETNHVRACNQVENMVSNAAYVKNQIPGLVTDEAMRTAIRDVIGREILQVDVEIGRLDSLIMSLDRHIERTQRDVHVATAEIRRRNDRINTLTQEIDSLDMNIETEEAKPLSEQNLIRLAEWKMSKMQKEIDRMTLQEQIDERGGWQEILRTRQSELNRYREGLSVARMYKGKQTDHKRALGREINNTVTALSGLSLLREYANRTFPVLIYNDALPIEWGAGAHPNIDPPNIDAMKCPECIAYKGQARRPRTAVLDRMDLVSQTWDASDAALNWGILADANHPDGVSSSSQTWTDATMMDFELRLCTHGTGRLAVMGWNNPTYRITPNYPIATSEISDALFDIPGGPIAAQLLLSLITGFLFWGAGGFITRGSTGAQPMLGLAGFVIGALAMPVFGYGGWFLAVMIIIIAVAAAMFFAQAVSGRV